MEPPAAEQFGPWTSCHDAGGVLFVGQRRDSSGVIGSNTATTKPATVGWMATICADPLNFTCPRCNEPSVADYYGPCDPCRTDLRARFFGEASALVVADYEPKMNVTPNAVALKE